MAKIRSKNIFDEERRENFFELYVSNIDKRLREIENPSDIDCKRWVWELIQNAKDSIVGQNNRKSVDIEIIVKDDIYIFKHNGEPFIKKTLYGLLYKYSKGKSDNAETTGRFGTGFLTTHSLSKIVEISGDINLNGKIEGFSFTMYREGEGEELLEGLSKTEDSFELHEKPYGWTTFKYLAKTERNKEAGKLGIQSFKDNITKVMLFCPEISSIKLDDNGNVIIIERGDIIDNFYDSCEKLILNVNDNNKHLTRNFIYTKYEEDNEKLNERFKKSRKLKICCAIELDNDNNVYVDELSPNLFCSLPFVGSEKHKLPFIINSQNFEPDSERQSILLDGKETNEITGKISEQGINKMILLKSQQMYENLLECLCNDDVVRKRYLLARGLTIIPKNDEIQNFDHEWYKEKFVKPMRDILIKYPLVWNGEQHIKLTDIHLPIIKYNNDDIQLQAYNFISQVYEKKVPTYEESIQYKDHIWKEDNRIKYVGMKECTQKISSFKNMNSLNNLINNTWKWIDNFLLFIKDNEFKYLGEYNIIPNMNSEFVKFKDNNIATSEEVPDNMIECIEKLGKQWKSNHIHKKIENFNLGISHNISYAVSVIKDDLKEWDNKILTVISYIPNDNNAEKNFVQKRHIIYELCSKVFKDEIPSKMDGSLFPKELWNGIDEIVFDKLIEKIEEQEKLGGIFDIEYMKKFLKCVTEFYQQSYKAFSIVPNQNGIFCKADELYEDIQIPELFKECMKNCFNYDIKNELIDNKLLSIKSLTNGRNRKIHSYNDIIKDYFMNEDENLLEIKQNAARHLIQIIPKETEDKNCEWQNDQRNLFNIYKIFVKNDIECYEIENEFCDKGLWKGANEYICDEITSIIEKCEDINELKSILNIENEDKDKIYEYLNILYKFRKEGIIVPNQYDQFCILNDLYNEGITNVVTKDIEYIPEKIKDIAKELEYDVRNRLIPPKIERICKNNISEKEVSEKIAKLMEDKKRSDPNFNNVADSLIEFNFEKIRNNALSDDLMYIFGKVIISNIINRLRELENPSDIDCKRWIWELIQNAKDSIVGQNDRKGVDIEVIIEGDKYIFKHNGSPFNKKTLSALLYKYTEGKSKNSNSTGHFGTGFLTTHSLSKTVKISGIIMVDGIIKGFEVTMFREGEEEEELLEGLNKTKNSYHEFDFEADSIPENERWTSYEYITKTERNKEAGKLGIQNFKENINKVMLFCPEISSIKLNDNGKIFTIKRGNSEYNLQSGCEKLELNINDNDEHYSRSFLYKRIEESNESLTERFKTDRKLRICCAIELDDSNNIFIDKSSPCLYCSLPLVGSEKHILPFIINSPDFEPDSERQSILLDGNEKNAKTDKISDQGINKMILLRSQEIYENLLECLCQNDIINKRYLLTRGIKTIPSNDEIQSFDHDWYEKHFVIPVRNILIKYSIVLSNDDKYIKLTNVHLPFIKCYEDLEIRKQAYDYISQVYNGNVPTYEESLQFENYIWREDERIKYIGMKKCIQYISEQKTVDVLSDKMSISDIWEWIDKFIIFIKENDNELLEQYSIIPNMNSEFVELNGNLASSKEVPDNMIECIEELEIAWKSNHIHKNIKKFKSGIDHNIKYATSIISNNLKEWSDKILTLISYIPTDNTDKEFVQKRNEIYDLCSKEFNDQISNKKDGSLFPKELWNGIDDIVFKKLIEKVENQGEIDGIFDIEYMKDFLKCVSEFYPSYKNHSIIPNQNDIFCKSNELYEDIQIPEIFKECMKNCFNYDIKNELIDNNLLFIKSLINGRKRNILDYIDNLRNYFQSKRISFENKLKASRYLIQIIPKETKDNKCEWQNEQRNLFNIYKIFIKNDIEYYEIENKYCDKGLWKDANEYICDEIISIIENCEDINELKSILNIENEDKDKIYEYLNILYKFRKEGIIVPNQYDQFCVLNDLYNEGITNIETKNIEFIPEKIKDIAKDLEYDVRKYLIHQKIERICNSNISEKEISEKIAKLMEEKKNSDPNFNNVANTLIEFNFEKIRNNTLSDELMYIFGKVIISNIINRLRELESPSDIDCKRWIWELIQNAKDSIVGQKNRKRVDIEIISEGDKYIFKHNGSPFNNKTLSALLYKFTEGKSKNWNSTGRFGTGFLTTHSLSKTVKISGIIMAAENIKRFEVTLIREGEEEEELLEGLNKTKNSYHEIDFEADSIPENERWTCYEYITKTERNKEAGKLGIQNLKENINKVMLFCPEINSIKLNDNGKIFTIKRGNSERNLQSGCEKLELNINDNNNYYNRKFLYKRIEESNELLTERFKTDRNLRICCAIELDDSNNIFIDESSPCLYCSLPLVGSEKHVLPFIINSPDFEPDS